MSTAAPDIGQGRLAQLRVELVELAFTLECQGRLDAADLALAVAARLEELNDPTPSQTTLDCTAAKM
ncbi:MAG: hypothetical protein IPN11_02855 [Opitutaceae bacterium]|nr:hypothetical protein [Opitutaceae bacterium]